MPILIDVVPVDKLREKINDYNPNDIIAIVVSKYSDGGWALSYQIIYRK